MKKTKRICSIIAALGFAASLLLAVTGCKSDTSDDTPAIIPTVTPGVTPAGSGESTTVVSEDIKDVAFNIFRGLCDLTVFDEDAVKDDDGNIVGGIEILPNDWRSRKFNPSAGFVLDKTNAPTVWSYPVASTAEAAEWFFELIGETSEDGTYPTTKTWTYSGIGTLTYNAVSGNDDIFATVDVKVSQLPDCTQIRFVPYEIIAANGADNAFSGTPYFTAGDVIRDVKNGTYWMCVRPAGGPTKQEKSYWICLSPFDLNGNCIIHSKEYEHTLPYPSSKDGEWQMKEVTWKYATNLMQLKTAKSAFHTFNLLAQADEYDSLDFCHIKPLRNALKDIGNDSLNLDIFHLHKQASSEAGVSDADKALWETKPALKSSFMFAYKGPTTDSSRSKTVKHNGYEKSGVAYIQPIFSGSGCKNGNKITETIDMKAENIIKYTVSIGKLDKLPLSATDAFDEAILECFYDYSSCWGQPFAVAVEQTEAGPKPTIVEPWDEAKWVYNYENFLHRIEKQNLHYVNPNQTYAKWCANEKPSYHIIFSPELKLSDNKGKIPFGKNAYQVIVRYAEQSGAKSDKDGYDWWKTLDVTELTVDSVKVEDLKKEFGQ